MTAITVSFKIPYFILITKAVVLVLIAMSIRATLPRYRFDQLMQLNWKNFIFFWFFSIVIITYLFVSI